LYILSSFFSFGKWLFNSGEKVYFSAVENEKLKRIILASIDFVGTKSGAAEWKTTIHSFQSWYILLIKDILLFQKSEIKYTFLLII